MKKIISAFVAGGVFSLGLVTSQMVNPAKVLGFLDLFGQWDPSLAFVMGGALVVTFFGYRLVLGQPKPIHAEQFHVPTIRTIDARLTIGSILFGIGWGLAGLCPGPAIAAIGIGGIKPLVFFIALVAGMTMHKFIPLSRTSRATA